MYDFIGFSHRSKIGREPEIVVDGHACMRKWYDGLDWTIGLEIQEFIEKLRNFVELFKNIGVELTFFFDGVHADHKYEVWRSRQRERIDKTLRAFDFFYQGGEFSCLPEELQSFPPNVGLISAFILKHVLKCTVSRVYVPCSFLVSFTCFFFDVLIRVCFCNA